jgi:hypothetical protein
VGTAGRKLLVPEQAGRIHDARSPGGWSKQARSWAVAELQGLAQIPIDVNLTSSKLPVSEFRA